MPEEFKKDKPPTFDGNMKKVEDAKAQFLGMKKFFRIHDYSENMKARVTTYSLKGKKDIWWEDLKNFRAIDEKELTQDEFEKLFREKYLSEHYYDGKAREFYELKMGQLSNEEYVTEFLGILRYVPIIKDEKAKIQRFISGFPMAFRDKIELLEPLTLNDAIEKMKHFYDQAKHRYEIKSNWHVWGSSRHKKSWPKKTP